MWKKTITGLFLAGAALGASTIDIVEVPEHYYVRTGSVTETNFESKDSSISVAQLKEAKVIGEACYDEFIKKGSSVRRRIDCDEYDRRASVKDYPNPVDLNVEEIQQGYTWRSYATLLFDTPSGDLEEGYYAKSEQTKKIAPLMFGIGKLTPKAEAVIAWDASASGGISGSSSSLSYSHTTAASSTIVVGTFGDDSNATDKKVNGCTFNSVPMFEHINDEAIKYTQHIFWLNNTSSGAQTVACTFNNVEGGPLDEAAVISGSVTGADLHIPVTSAKGTGTASSAEASASITTTVDDSWVFDFMMTNEGGSNDIIPGGDLHTERVELGSADINTNLGTAGAVVTAGATTTSWSWTGTELWKLQSLEVREPCSAEGERCTEIVTTIGTTTWTSPANLTSVDVACWGGGGGGGVIANSGGGGGGGGAYATTTGIAITGSTGYSVHIGAGGASDTGLAGGNSQFLVGASYSPVACGGVGATSETGGAGGTTACSVGSAAENAGGAGGAGTTSGDAGGGGGGAAGPNGAGVAGDAAASSHGGAGGAGDNGSGGTGGRPATSNPPVGGDGNGHIQGGGGGGGADDGQGGDGFGGAGAWGSGGGGGEELGGVGGQGMCQFSYIVPAAGGAARRTIIWPQ